MRPLGRRGLLVAGAALGLGLCGCVLSEDERIDRELAASDFVLRSEPDAPLIETPGTFSYASGSTVHLADNHFDSFEIEGLLRESIVRRAAALGLTHVPSGGDYRVGYLITADDGTMVAEAMASIGAPAPPSGAARRLPRGTLVLTLGAPGAPGARALLWKGSLEGAIDPDHSPDKREERVDLAVAALLRELRGKAPEERP